MCSCDNLSVEVTPLTTDGSAVLGALIVTEGVGSSERLLPSDLESGTSDVAELEAGTPEVATEAVPAVEPSFIGFAPALNTSLGKSATAMVISPISPIKAAVTAEIGSQGWPSVWYSIDRYLNQPLARHNILTP